MRRTFCFLGVILLGGIVAAFGQPSKSSQSADPAPAPIPQQDVDKKNPVKPSPDGIAQAKKIYGYDCAMCHGAAGDGKGDLASDMKLQMNDWHDPATLSKYTDGALFYVITNGRGKMGGEGDRAKEDVRWNLVNLVRSLAKKT
jgi:mono/diheme cytochrome c family protein